MDSHIEELREEVGQYLKQKRKYNYEGTIKYIKKKFTPQFPNSENSLSFISIVKASNIYFSTI